MIIFTIFRYRLPATTTESMAVSPPCYTQCDIPTLENPLNSILQTYPYSEDRTASILRCWHHICSHRRALTLRQCSGSQHRSTILRRPQTLLIVHLLQVQEISIDYSHCHDIQNDTVLGDAYVTIPSNYTSSSFKGSDKNCSTDPIYQWRQYSINKTYATGTTPVNTSICSLRFNIPDNLKPPVLLYYRLTNFYQNHRRYVKSLDSDQLKGTDVKNNSLGACDPLNTDHTGKPYYPCGLIANSVFNDTINKPVQLNVHYSNAKNITYNMTTDGIAWSSDAALYHETKYNLSEIAVPPNWYLRWQNGYSTENPPPALEKDYGFQVWMRTAGLPNFSKLALRNDNETMQCSQYQVDIENSMSSSFYR